MKQTETSNNNILAPVALTVLVVAGVGSLYFLFRTAQNQSSVFLLGLFVCWVISPYIGLLVANKISKSWARGKRTSLYWLMIFLAVCSLIAYSGVFIPAGTKPAFIFLVIPLISWFIIVIGFLMRKNSKKT